MLDFRKRKYASLLHRGFSCSHLLCVISPSSLSLLPSFPLSLSLSLSLSHTCSLTHTHAHTHTPDTPGVRYEAWGQQNKTLHLLFCKLTTSAGPSLSKSRKIHTCAHTHPHREVTTSRRDCQLPSALYLHYSWSENTLFPSLYLCSSHTHTLSHHTHTMRLP